MTLTATDTITASKSFVGVRDVSVSQGIKDLFPNDSLSEVQLISEVQGSTDDEQSGQTPVQTDDKTKGEQKQEQRNLVSTGDRAKSVVYLGILVAAVLVIVILAVKYRKFRVIGLVLVVGTVSAAMAFTAYANTKKGELNGDGIIDEADVVLLEQHLVSLGTLSDEQKKMADMNQDGQLTVTDVSLLLKRADSNIEYTVSMESTMKNPYVEQGAEVVLEFTADVDHGESVEKVTVNQEKREVSLQDDGTYRLTLPAQSKAGAQTYRISAVTLTNGREVTVDFTQKVDILKKDVEISQFQANQVDNTNKMKVSFLITDPDKAVSAANLVLSKADSDELVTQKTVHSGENELTLELEENVKYRLDVCAEYRRDSQALDENKTDFVGTATLSKEVQLSIQYDLTFGELKVYSGTIDQMTETTELAKQENFYLGFTSSNLSEYAVESIVVNGKMYPVSKQENSYLASTLPPFTERGVQTLKIEKVILQNGKTFPLTENNTIQVTVTKEKPSVGQVQITETKDALHVALNLQDTDQVLKNPKLIVIDDKGNVLSEQEIGTGNVTVDVDLKNKLTSTFRIEIRADYDIGNSTGEQKNYLLYVEEMKAQPRVEVTSAEVDRAHVEAGDTVKLTYAFQHNLSDEVTRVVVNGQVLDVVKEADGRYSTSYIVNGKAGIKELELSVVCFGETTVDAANTVQTEILKQAPTASEYYVEDDFDQKEVHIKFSIDDPDQSMTEGKVVLTNESDPSDVMTEALTMTGDQDVVFRVKEKSVYKAELYLSYARSVDGSFGEKNKLIASGVIQLLDKYDLQVTDLRADRQYIGKSEEVVVSFKGTTQSIHQISQVEADGSWYKVAALPNETDQYTFTMKGYDTAGVKKIQLTQVRMSNGKVLDVPAVPEDQILKVEVLKTEPTVAEFVSEQTVDDILRLNFQVKDPDQAITDGNVVISANGQELVSKKIQAGANEVSTKLVSSESYTVTIQADYDLDTNALTTTDNTFQDVVLYTTQIAVKRDAIEMKDVTAARLFQNTSGGPKEISVLDIQGGIPTDVENYYVMIESDTLPVLYTNVKEFRMEDEILKVVVEQDALIQRVDGARKNEYIFDLAYEDKNGVHALIKSAEELFQMIRNDLDGTFKLTEDLDASDVSTAAAAIPGDFSGTLNGNGHKILNLPTSLFDTVTGGTIENLILEDAKLTKNESGYAPRGILANVIKGKSVIESVYVVDSVFQNEAVNSAGGFAGQLTDSLTKSSAAINLNFKGRDTIGGMYGETDAKSVIQDNYVTGTLQGVLYHDNLGTRVGGLVGWNNAKLERVYAKVSITAPNQFGSGGLIGGPKTGSPIMKDSFALTNGKVYRLAGFNTFGNTATQNLYEYKEASAATNIVGGTEDKIKTIDDATLQTKEFYRDTLGFDEAIWNLDLVTAGKLPSLQTDPTKKKLEDYEIEENKNQIPNYEDVREHEGYTKEREIAYRNMAKLMPYADIATWIEQGNALDSSSNFVQKKIDKILPRAADGSLVTGLTTDSLGELTQVLVTYQDGSKEKFALTYQKLLGDLIASYQLGDRAVGYQFTGYVTNMANIDPAWLSQLAQTVYSWSYDEIAAVTKESESRLYRDYYEEQIRTSEDQIKALLTKLLVSQAQYPSYLVNSVAQEKWKAEFSQADRLKNLMYAYNYYDKWYRVNFDGISLSDVLFFDGKIFSSKMTSEQMVQDLLSTAEKNRYPEGNYSYYTNVMKKYLNQDLMEFLGGLATTWTDYQTPNEWFTKEFKGLLLEKELESQTKFPKYQMWDVMQNLGDRKNLLLPILTAPQEDMYMISAPSQLIIGSMNGYSSYHTGGSNNVLGMMQAQAQTLARFLGVSVEWVPNGEKILNSFVNVHYDSIMNFPAHGNITAGNQLKGKTNDPVIKWVYEAVNQVNMSGGNVGAYASGTNVTWNVTKALNSGSYLLTHEMTHNLDGRYFYNEYGRRGYTGAEAHTDGNMTQFGSVAADGGSLSVLNMFREVTPDTDMPSNFSYKRINTAEKVHTYYQGMFETRYLLDYLAAQAFLELTPAEQAKVAIRVVEKVDTDGFGMSVDFSAISEDEIRSMNLRTIEDLWKNKIMWRTATGSASSARGGNANNRGSFYDMTWYQAHNDTGTGDSENFKRLGQEMLGYAGYEKGYIRFMSDYVKKVEGKLATDLAVIQSISGDPNMTWEKYKMGRFQNVKNHLSGVVYFDPKVVQQEFKKAFESDAKNNKRGGEVERVKRLWFGVVKRATNEFATGEIYGDDSIIEVNSAQELLDAIAANPMGYYRLSKDLDFDSITANGPYISESFYGVLDGAGHKMTNVHSSLFKDIKYAHIKDLTIENPSYVGASKSVLAETGTNLTLSRVQVIGSDTHLPFVLSKKGTYQEYDSQIDYVDTTIKSVEDFMKIAASDASLRKDYVLDADLDFSGQAPDGGLYVLNTTFYGSLDGNGHTIKGLRGTLFHTIKEGTIENLRITGLNFNNPNVKGSLASVADGVTLKNIRLDTMSIRAQKDWNTSRDVGGLIGSFKNGSASGIFVSTDMVEGYWYVGGVFGRAENSTITDVYVQGTVKSKYWNYNEGNRVGGVVGYADKTTFRNVFSKATITQDYGYVQGSGGIVGYGDHGDTVTILDSVSLNTGKNTNRIADPKLLGTSSNVYELLTSLATSNITDANQDRIHSVTEETLRSKEFYTKTLGWSEEIWNFDNVAVDGTPILKNLPSVK